MAEEPVKPHSEEAEQAVLGAILVNAAAIQEVISFLKPPDFFLETHAWIFDAMLNLRKRKEPIDYLTVVAELEQMGHLKEIGGAAYILSLVNKTPSALNCEGYGRIVERTALRRKLIEAASKIARKAHSEDTEIDDVLKGAERAVLEVTSPRMAPIIQSIRQVTSEAMDEQLVIQTMDKGHSLALPTPWPEIDQVTDLNLELGRLVYLVGISGHGKSTFVGQLADRFSRQHWVLFVSQEMASKRVYNRIVCARACKPFHLLRESQGQGRVEDWYQRECQDLEKNHRLFFVQQRVTAREVARFASVLRQRYDEPGVIIIDTMQKMKGGMTKDAQLYEGLTRLSSEVNGISLNGDLVIGTVQIRTPRENTTRPKDWRPSASNMKGTGAWFEDADVVLGVYFADNLRQKLGPAFVDERCPPGMAVFDAIKLRDGDIKKYALLEFKTGIPMFCSPQPDPTEFVKKLKDKEECKQLAEEAKQKTKEQEKVAA